MHNKLFRIIIAIAVAIFLIVAGIALTGCNKQMVDTVYQYKTVIMTLPNDEVIEGSVQKWNDYDGDQIQVMVDGKYYLIHSSDCVLISE